MPKGDRTGPSGQGPGTGKALGYCYGYDTPGYTADPGRGMKMGYGFGRGASMGRGLGWGRGGGRGKGFGRHYRGLAPGFESPQALSREDEIKLLKNQAEALKRSQNEIEKRLEELDKE